MFSLTMCTFFVKLISRALQLKFKLGPLYKHIAALDPMGSGKTWLTYVIENILLYSSHNLVPFVSQNPGVQTDTCLEANN